MAGYGFKRPEATYRITLNAKNLTRVNVGPVGFKPGSNEGYYFKIDPEFILSSDAQF